MTATQHTFSPCCLRSFSWTGTPAGRESTLAENSTYITGSNTDAAVLFIHDALGWRFKNARLLADHIAQEANVTVYIPDFFGGESLDPMAIQEERFGDIDMAGFRERNERAVREKEIFACATALRSQHGYSKIGTVGYCYGGWGVLRLASRINGCPPLVDAAVVAHPSWITNEDWDHVEAPIMVLAPEVDSQFTEEMKAYAFQKMVVQKKSVPFEYVHLPGVHHGCLSKGREWLEGEKEAMTKGKDRTVTWFAEWLSRRGNRESQL